MAYNIFKTDNSPLVTLLDGEVDTSTTDLTLLGKNYLGYGDLIAENFVKLLENFQRGSAPESPLRGQVWFDSSSNPGVVRVNVSNNSTPDWRNVALLNDGTGFEEATIEDVDGYQHKAIKAKVNGVLVAILSTDADYTPALFELQNDPSLITFLGESAAGVDGNLGDGDYNRTGKIGKGLNLNSSSDFKIRGVAVEAQFADVAEIYVGDAGYEAGTVVALGGEKEVTQTTQYADTNVFGIVSTRPAYLLNSKHKDEKNALPIAVAGRIPVKVTGVVKRGDRLVASDIPGVAQAAPADAPAWSIIGRSLGDFAGEGIGKIEATVGVR